MKLNLIANCFGNSGYAVHGYNLARGLIAEGVDLGIESARPQNWQQHELREQLEKNFHSQATVMISTPEWWDLMAGDRLPFFGPFGVFEGSRIPYGWKLRAEKKHIDMIFVPSKHTELAFRNAGVDKIFKIIPHGYNPEIFNTDGPKAELPQLKGDFFKFLFVGGWKDGINDRKGLDIALRAFCNEFRADEKVQFIAKFNMAYQSAENIIYHINSLDLPKERPEVILLLNDAPEKELANLYRSADCFVMPSKAEAFCMPCLEAMACGLPVLTTNYGGQIDYVPKEWLIDISGMARATGEFHIYSETEWAIPNQKHLQQLMRKAFEGQFKGKPELIKNYTWQNSAKKLVQAISSVV
jgi:glycosyltransferase involved in cell wall biosynthesis